MTPPAPSLYPKPGVVALEALVLERPPTLGRSRLLCIDGPAGSGKTTLAAELGQVMAGPLRSVDTLHMDDFYEGWSGLDRAGELEPRIITQALHPLSEGRPGRWQRYDWKAGRRDEWVDLLVPDLLIMEGCGAGAVAYAEHITALVWVEAARDTRISRGLARDGEATLPLWLAWMDSEARHFAANRTRERADVAWVTG